MGSGKNFQVKIQRLAHYPYLLDETNGSYNTAFTRRHFSNGGVRLIEYVVRTQWLIAANGNPLNISGIEDLSMNDLRYVNR